MSSELNRSEDHIFERILIVAGEIDDCSERPFNLVHFGRVFGHMLLNFGDHLFLTPTIHGVDHQIDDSDKLFGRICGIHCGVAVCCPCYYFHHMLQYVSELGSQHSGVSSGISISIPDIRFLTFFILVG